MRRRILFLAIIVVSALPAFALSTSGRDPVGTFRATVRGSGTLQYGGLNREAVRGVTVQFQRNGVAEIRLVGDRTTTLVGRWFGGRGETVDLEILGGFGTSLSTGRGQLTLQG